MQAGSQIDRVSQGSDQMAVAANNSQAIIEIVNQNIEPALRFALKNPLENSLTIANLTQLRQACSIAVKLSNNEVAAVASFNTDLPFYDIALSARSDEDTRCLFRELTRKHPQLLRSPVFGLYNMKTAKIIEKYNHVISKIHELKMVLSADEIPAIAFDSSRYKLERLTTADLVQISHLYRLVPAMAWTPKLLTLGPYYGVYYKNNLVCIAGVHFTTKWVTEIGNIVTHFKHCRQGLAYWCTKSVINAVKNTCSQIFLCVLADNTPAIRLYEKMGFVKTEDLYLVQYYIR